MHAKKDLFVKNGHLSFQKNLSTHILSNPSFQNLPWVSVLPTGAPFKSERRVHADIAMCHVPCASISKPLQLF